VPEVPLVPDVALLPLVPDVALLPLVPDVALLPLVPDVALLPLVVQVQSASNFSLKAAALHNYLLNKNSEYKTKYDLIKDGKVKYFYCKHPVNNVFAYLRGFYPLEIVQKENVQVDYEVQFDKTVLSISNDFLKALDLPLINKRIAILNSLFGFKLDEKKPYEMSILSDYDDDDDDE